MTNPKLLVIGPADVIGEILGETDNLPGFKPFVGIATPVDEVAGLIIRNNPNVAVVFVDPIDNPALYAAQLLSETVFWTGALVLAISTSTPYEGRYIQIAESIVSAIVRTPCDLWVMLGVVMPLLDSHLPLPERTVTDPLDLPSRTQRVGAHYIRPDGREYVVRRVLAPSAHLGVHLAGVLRP